MAPENWALEEGALHVLGVKDTSYLDDHGKADYEEVLGSLRRHADQGKGIAYYTNEDLGHPMLGHTVAFTYGTPEAQFEPDQFPDGPPEQCPDGLMKHVTGGINWRYRLKAVTTSLPAISEPDWATVSPRTQVWVAVDIAADGPDGVVVLERLLGGGGAVLGWRIINPANDEDALSFEEIRNRLKTVFEEQGPIEPLPFEQDTGVPPESPAYQGKIGEHLVGRHGYHVQYVAVKIREGNQADLVEQHNRLHSDPTSENLHHSHESLRPEDL